MKRGHTAKSSKKLFLFFLKIIGFTIGSLACLAIILVFVLPRPIYKTGFKNLSELQQYAQGTPELVPMSNKNTLKPEFSTYYEQFKPTFGFIVREKLTYLATVLHLAKRPVFSVGFFKTLIETMTKERELKGQSGGTVICKVATTATSKFIIFGNVQSAFHSVVRDLEKLKELNLINDQLQLTQPDSYVFFTGNVINRSCYSMETMAAVTRFAQVNPDRVFYLRGNHESSNYWQEHTLKTELQLHAAHLSKELIPLAIEVNNFFATLPEAAYLTIPGASHEFIRISYAGRTKNETLNENNYAAFLTETSSQPVAYTVVKEKKDAEVPTQPIVIKVIFRDEKKRETYQPMEGLRFLAPDIDSVAWNILSCPTYVYQRAIKFKHDAFVVLEANEDINNWKLNLYSRDATTKDTFKVTMYNMLSGVNVATNKPIERDRPKKSKKAKSDKKIKKDKKKPPRSLVPSDELTPTEEPAPQEVKKEAPTPQKEIAAPVVQAPPPPPAQEPSEKPQIAEQSLLVPPPPPPPDPDDFTPPPPSVFSDVPPPPPDHQPHTSQPAQGYPPAPIYQTIIYPPPGAHQLPTAGNVAVTPQPPISTTPESSGTAPSPANTEKMQQTLDKIHSLLLRVTTTLDRMQARQYQPRSAPTKRPTAKNRRVKSIYNQSQAPDNRLTNLSQQ